MMKSSAWRLGLAAACAVLAIFGRATPVFAAEPERGGAGDRLDRLEQRLDEVIQHQEQLMRRLGAQQDQAPMGAVGRDDMRPMTPQRNGARIGHPMPPPGAPEWAGMPAPAGPPAAAAKLHKGLAGLVKLCVLVAIVFNILLAVWIYSDIRKRGEGSGIFIVLALLAGIPAAIIYSLVRIGDKRP